MKPQNTVKKERMAARSPPLMPGGGSGKKKKFSPGRRQAPGSPEVCWNWGKKGNFKDECSFVRCKFCKSLGHRIGECTTTPARWDTNARPVLQSNRTIPATKSNDTGKNIMQLNTGGDRRMEAEQKSNAEEYRGPIMPPPKTKPIIFILTSKSVVLNNRDWSKHWVSSIQAMVIQVWRRWGKALPQIQLRLLITQGIWKWAEKNTSPYSHRRETWIMRQAEHWSPAGISKRESRFATGRGTKMIYFIIFW